MRSYVSQVELNRIAVLAEYVKALKDQAYELAEKIRESNSDLETDFKLIYEGFQNNKVL